MSVALVKFKITIIILILLTCFRLFFANGVSLRNDEIKISCSSKDESFVPKNFKDKLHFFVITFGNYADCGGCKVLLQFVRVLDELGYSVDGIDQACPSYEQIKKIKEIGKSAVFLYPEVIEGGCYDYGLSLNDTHVRWILGPPGMMTDMTVASWKSDDFVFSYNPGLIHGPGSISNTLFVTENPKVGDETDIPDSVFYSKERSGILWTLRKATKFHTNLEIIHNHTNLNVTQKESLSVYELRNYEYFVSYDPYTYWIYLAAMSGAVSIIYPIRGVSKERWIQSTFFNEYLQFTGKTYIPGIAYGWVESELTFARETMHELRAFMMDVKKWGEEFTVNRLARDCYRHIIGMRTNFEAAGFVRNLIPTYDEKLNFTAFIKV